MAESGSTQPGSGVLSYAAAGGSAKCCNAMAAVIGEAQLRIGGSIGLDIIQW